ncbi:MAG TPA: TrmH family RNA methyltransferase [Spirochaetales bacterium]|nr:TrmH family RNA methyltransferase [Spirochaetales bacterium]
MIKVSKLASLHGVARTRKCALVLERLELELSEQALCCDSDNASAEVLALPQILYAQDLAGFLVADYESSEEVRKAAQDFLDGLADNKACSLNSNSSREGLNLNREQLLRPINNFKHALMRASGQAPADWDFHNYVTSSNAEQRNRAVDDQRGSLRVYLEDIRSPFNVGTIFRTAEAFGFAEVLLSPDCADPLHPRALRSSMGAVDMMSWRRCPLEEAMTIGQSFALELGGKNIYDFSFPKDGIVVLGSEELGVSQKARGLVTAGLVSIPMFGTKASVNVAVAFGIAASLWSRSVF